MKKIEAIIFDLGGVILDIDYNLTKAAFEKLGSTHFDEMYSQAEADDLFRRLETGDVKPGEFYTEFNKSSGLHLSPEEISGAWNAMLLTFREESLTFLERIKTRYRLFLLSNTNEIHYEVFKQIYFGNERSFVFEDYFEKAYYSFDMGKRKPDADIFEAVLQENNLNPLTTLFIDDSIQNIEAAKQLGIQTIHLTAGMLIEDVGL